jgi:glycosyltransferase involved in cell wall biosynthesis
MKSGITCVIPAHNEGQGIFETIIEIDSQAPAGFDFTIFVSEDGSKDDTRTEVLRAADAVKNSSVVLSSPANRLGYSKAVQRGISECKTELICFMDADGQCDPADLTQLISKLVTGGGIVVGYRNPRVDGYNRIAYSKLFGVAYRLLGGPKRIDTSSPFVAARTEEIRALGNVDCHLSFGFWWEFQWRIDVLGINTTQIPVNHRVRTAGETQVYTIKRLPRIIRTHVKGLWDLRKELQT